MEHVEIFTDGSYSSKTGIGGWGTILRQSSLGLEQELCGYESPTTNNRMELTAVLKGLEALQMPCSVNITSDSLYVINPVVKGWVYRWRANNWITAEMKSVKNMDLWARMLHLLDRHQVTWEWVHGHKGHVENERCDFLANYARSEGTKP